MKSYKGRLTVIFVAVMMILLSSCAGDKKNKLSIPFEKYTLENGLDVVLHQDKSDPIVAVAIQYHVGSNREVKGRTGFAHLFEHMMFQQSENVKQGQLFKKIENAGGELNGGTRSDGTVYYEVVPKNALEMVLWLESDRLGYLSNTVTQKAFAMQQNVVQNEKRQSMDNRPYGFTNYLIDKNLYPDTHPYNWQVIGEMADLKNATIADVKDFHKKFYVPNNATLVVAGDYDPLTIKELIKKYFGEIAKGDEVKDMKPMPVILNEKKRLFHEDNFATMPQITLTWPTLQQFTKDAYALDYLGQLLSVGKKAPLYKVLVEEKKLTSRTIAYNSSIELAGKFSVRITANEGIGLTDIEKGIFEAFAKFEKDGISDKDMERLKAKTETEFYQGINSILGKSFQLAFYNEYAGDPSFIETDLKNTLAVTKEDIMSVYKKYIKDKNYIETSFVPKGKQNLMAENSVNGGITEEKVTEATENRLPGKDENDSIIKTKTSFDRSKEPPVGPQPELNVPSVWKAQLADGMKVFGIEQHELPLVEFSLRIDGGQLQDEMNKAGEANLVAEMLMAGTKNKTPEQLEEAIELLGSSIYVRAGREGIEVSGSALARNFQPTLDLVKEILLEPRWDEKEFGIAKTKVLNTLKQRKADPNFLASLTFNKILYGKDHIFSFPTSGNDETVNGITLDDLKAYYERSFSPSVSSFHIAGDINQKQTEQALSQLSASWKSKEVKIPEYKAAAAPGKSSIYFVDLPGAKQSVIDIGYLALSRKDPDYYPATVMNFKLGGTFNSVLNMILRETKGFTYGAHSYLNGTMAVGPFMATSSVRSNTTQESVTIFRNEMTKYREGPTKEDFDFTQSAILKANALRFETLGALLNMLKDISAYNLPVDYVKQEEATVRAMSPETIKQLAMKYINPDKMIYVVVGDAATQMKPLKSLGFGDPILYKP
jgi:zinc protease